MMLPRLTKALALVTSILMLSACAMGGGQPVTSAPPTLEPKNEESAKAITGSITVWSWDVAATALKRLAAEYEKTHSDTKIEVVDVGYDNAYDKISVGLQAGSGLPDLITVETDRLPGYLQAFPDKFVDLSSTLVNPADVDQSKLAAAKGADDKVYALPWDSGPVALYYRADYLKEAGIEPSSLVNWDDVYEAGKKLKEKGHTTLDTDLSSGGLFLMLLQQQGKGIFDKDGKVALDSPEALAALTWMKKMFDAGLINNVKGWDARVSAAKSGKSAVLPQAVWWMGTLTSEATELKGKYGVQPLPVFAEGQATTSNNGGSNLAIPAQAKNPELAADFAAFVLLDKANQVSMMKNEGLFPAYLPALDDPLFAADDPYFGDTKPLKTFAELTKSIPPVYYTGDYAKANQIVADATAQAVLGRSDAKAALTAAAKDIASQTGRELA